jgi:methyl-accepting chemotaxis protein
MPAYFRSIRFRIWVIAVVLLIPQAIQFYLLNERARADISFSEKERAGVVYLRAVWPVRVAASIASGQSGEIKDASALLKPLLEQQARFGTLLGTEKEAGQLINALKSAPGAAATHQISLYTDALIEKIGDTSNLILDPDLDSYYLMSLAVERFIDLSREAAETVLAAQAVAKATTMSIAPTGAYHSWSSRVQSSREKIAKARNSAENNTKDTTLKPRLETRFDEFFSAYGRFFAESELFHVYISAGDKKGLDTARLEKANLELQSALAAVYDVTLGGLDQLLETRIGKHASDRNRDMMIAAFAILVAYSLAYSVVQQVMRSMFTLRNGLIKMAEGDLTTKMAGTGRRDEMGSLARAATRLRDSIVERLNTNFSEERDELMRREHTRAVAVVADDLRDTVQNSIASIDKLGLELSQSVQFVSDSAISTRTAINSSVEALDSASANVRAATEGLVDVSNAVSEIAEQAAAAASVSREAKAGGELAKARAADLSNSMREIEAILKMVQSIAGQTNLLALNATIEAARAGEAGRGFAIVAQEVKNLAMQTAKATDDINGRMATVANFSDAVSDAIDNIVVSIASVDTAAVSIASAVEQHNVTTATISERVREAVVGSAQAVAQIENVATAADTTGQIADDLDGLARKLSGEASHLKSETNRLIERLTA